MDGYANLGCGVWIFLVRRTICDVTAGKFVVIRTSLALVLIYKF